MRKNGRRSPEVEALDTRTLLSGVAAAAGLVTGGPALHLAGAMHGIAVTDNRGDETSFAAKGNVSPLGTVKTRGGESLPRTDTQIAFVTGPNASYNLITPAGSVFVATDISAVGRRHFSGVYTIQGGTGAYAGATGTGPVTVSYLSTKFALNFGSGVG